MSIIYRPSYFKLSDANYVPKRREVSAVSNAKNALVTTTEDHGYEVGQLVRMHVSDRYGMDLPGVSATVLTVPSTTTFTLNIDTTSLATYVTPTYSDGNGFTQSHVVPITGTELNTA